MRKIYVVGIGMGNSDTVTVLGKKAIENCQGLIGAERMVRSFIKEGQECCCTSVPDEIIRWIEENSNLDTVGILMSGDIGFFSGARKLREKITERYGNPCGNNDMEISYIPGVSSISYFSAKTGIPWDDAKIVSLHGKDETIEESLKSAVQNNCKTFVLTDGGENNVIGVCRELTMLGLGNVKVYVGERLSYENERITVATAKDILDRKFDPLSVMFIINEVAANKKVADKFYKNKKTTLGISDNEFVRGVVPMTKEEVRTVAVSKLDLKEQDTVYDIGAGTGSVSVEIARACPLGKVYAVETNHQGVELIWKNKELFDLQNLEVEFGEAPSALIKLPSPDKAFIGGTKGKLNEIVELLLSKNPKVRIVINAITLETIAEAVDTMKKYQFENVEIVQLNVSKSKAIGNYNLMTAQNPVYIISGNGTNNGEFISLN